MTHDEFDHILGSIDALSPERLLRLRGEPDRKFSGSADAPTQNGGDAEPAEKPIWEEILDLTADIPEEEWDKLPVDLAEQHDHYIYGISSKNNPFGGCRVD